MDAIMADPRLGRSLSAPSISAGRDNLYMRGEGSCHSYFSFTFYFYCVFNKIVLFNKIKLYFENTFQES